MPAAEFGDEQGAGDFGAFGRGVEELVGEGGDVTLGVSPDLLRRQVTLIGSWTFSINGQAECARFIADRNIDIDALFTDRWRLGDAEHAYEVFDQQTKGKGVFVDFA